MHDKLKQEDPAITHFPSPIKEQVLDRNQETIAFIAKRFEEIMEALGLDLTDPSLAKTPYRVAKMYVEEIFSGLNSGNFPPISFIENKYNHGQRGNIVFVQVHFTSFCEHHFVPMMGKAYVAYLPHRKLIGLSKIPRIVKYFASRPQVQERLTAQIADSLATLLETEDVAVAITATHFCVLARGIEDQNSFAATNVFRGAFEKDANVRQEFFEAMRRNDKVN